MAPPATGAARGYVPRRRTVKLSRRQRHRGDSMIETAAARVVAEIFDLYAGAGHRDYIGECVSQLDHALQCAHFARAGGASAAQIVAALLHDIGHLCAGADAREMESLGIADHEVL